MHRGMYGRFEDPSEKVDDESIKTTLGGESRYDDPTTPTENQSRQ